MKLGIVLFTAINAVLPIILLIILGYILKEKKFLNENFVKVGNSLVFNVCLPAMLFVNVYDIEGLAVIRWDIVLYCVVAILLIFIVGFLAAIACTSVPERRGVILQCVFRSNFAIIGLPLAGALGGSEAMAIAAVISAFTIPVFNILAVISLSIFIEGADGEKASVKKILTNIIKNPLIIGVLLGLACVLIRTLQIEQFGYVAFSIKNQMKFLYVALSTLKSATSPLALIVLGAQFEFSAVKGLRKEIIIGVILRVLFAPALGLGLVILLSNCTTWIRCGVNEFPALIALFGSPVAVSSAVMARSMKNDEQLATQLVVWTSIASIFTIIAIVSVLMMFGYLRV